jgi:predicted kinase
VSAAQTTLIVMSGLPGTGKSAIARALAVATGAVWLRIDSIETAIADAPDQLEDAGYRAAYAVATDNLQLGLDVIGDSVNPWKLTRDAWRDVGLAAGAQVVEVEVVCSDAELHRRRVEERAVDVPGLVPPTWAEVIGRDYHPWHRERLVIDTARSTLAEAVAQVMGAL